MDFNVTSWVGDVYHKVESMIQEVDDIMKEKADPVGQNGQDSSENKKKFSFIEVQAALKWVTESYCPLTNGKKPEEGQQACGPPANGIIVESDESEEGNTEATSDCKSTLNCVDEVSQVITRHSEITQSVMDFLDPKTSESEPATRVACSVSRHSSMSLEFPSEIGEDEKPTTSIMGRNLQDGELKDSESSTPSLVDLVKELSVDSPGIHFNSSLSDINGGTNNFKEAVLESSKCEDGVASIVEKDLYEMLLVNRCAVDGNNIDEGDVVSVSLPARPVHCDESRLHLEVGETRAEVKIFSDLINYAPNASSVNHSLVAITAKLMEQEELEALTYDYFEKSIINVSKLSHSPLSVTAACGIDEPVPLANLLEEDERQFQDSGKCGAYLIDPNMETIDLEDKEELQESCATVDVRDLLAVSERVKRFRSIKRKILDAFASRRRTSKEYEQLGILHGDVNFEHGGHLMPHTVPSLDNPSSIEHADDSDWELL